MIKRILDKHSPRHPCPRLLQDSPGLRIRLYQSVGHCMERWIKQDLIRYGFCYDTFFHVLKPQDSANILAQTNGDLSQRRGSLMQPSCSLMQPLAARGQERPENFDLGNKINIHSTSGKFSQFTNQKNIVDLAFSVIGCQTPTKVAARQSISGFKLSKNADIGSKVSLRNSPKYEFSYKWYFIEASSLLPLHNLRRCQSKTMDYHSMGAQQFSKSKKLRAKMLVKSSKSVGIKEAFVFNELDILDYDNFSNMQGFEIQFSR